MPGVTVYLHEDVSIIVKGILKACGTEEDPITFTHNDTGEYWGTIKFTDQCIDTECIIKYCNIWYGGLTYSDYGGVWCQGSSPTIVNSNFSYNHRSGVWSAGSPTITNNTFFSTSTGVFAGGSPLISNNTFLENYMGIDISYSSGTITNNYIADNTYGVYRWGANNPFICGANISYNVIVNNTYGIWLAYSWGPTKIDSNILIGNNNGIYFKYDIQNVNIINTTIELSIGPGIYLHGTHNDIIDCYIRNNAYGILLPPGANNNHVEGCILSNNGHGIYIDPQGAIQPSIRHNTLVGNSILHSSGYGIYLPRGDGYSVGYFLIYHNNFVNNTINAQDNSIGTSWDSKGEGNFWDDYNGSDNNSDGIGDTPYNISGDSNKDYFPLMEPYGRPEIKVSTNDPVCINEEVIFDATEICDPHGTFVRYRWDFDETDGITVDAEGMKVNTTYAAPGVYVVTLSITDIFGYVVMKKMNITVGIKNIEISKAILLESLEDKIKISATINNTGTLDVKNVAVYLYANTQMIGSKTLDIPTNTSATAALFWKAQVGHYTLNVVADPDNTVFEIDETDNSVFLSLNLTDLSIAQENVTITDTDEGVQITVHLWNYGPIENNAEVAIYRGTDLMLSLSGIVESNSSTTFIGLINLPGGTHNISIIADPENKILETNENNNVIFTTTIVTGLPDLCVLSSDIVFDPYPPIEASNATADITIRNVGYSHSSLAQIRVYDRTSLLGNFLISSLAPNGYAVLSVNFTVCRDSEIRVEIEPYGKEFNPNNNYCTKTTNITLISDLSISSDDITFYPQNLTENQTALVYARIRNIGSLVSENAIVVFYDDDVTITEIPISALAGLSSTVVWTEFQAKRGHVITVKINSSTDANQENNIASRTILKTLLADLCIVSADILFEGVAPPIENRSTVISATIRNYGDAPSETALISFFVEDILINAVEVAPIEPNASRKVWVVWENAKEGMIITVRINTTAFDNNTANNEASILLEKTLKPDLIISAVKTDPSYPQANQKVTLLSFIMNIGDGESDAAIITFYDNGEVINTTRIGSVLPNQTIGVWTEWTAQPNHIVSVTIQSENYELDTTNNKLSVEIEVYVEQPLPLIVIVAVAGVAALSLVIYFFTETGKWKLIILTLPVYSKLKEKDLFSSEYRTKIYGFVQMNPGAHLSLIARGANVPTPVAVYHLDALEIKFKKIRSENKRTYKYFWPVEVWAAKKVWKEPWIMKGLTKFEGDLYQIIKTSPGLSQQEIVNKFKKAQSTISYHLDKLKEKNIITAKRVGKEIRYYPVPEEA